MSRSGTARKRDDDRIEIRAKSEVKETLQRAADATGSTLSAFMLSNALEVAKRVLAEQDRFILSDLERDHFLKTLDKTTAPNAALKAAVARYRKLYRS